MAYALEQFASDVRQALSEAPIETCSAQVTELVRKALTDEAFVGAYLPERTEGQDPREVLYEDPDLGFCICGHVYSGEAIGTPHDHGSSWAVYGQAAGSTEMTDWKIVEQGEGAKPSLVMPVRTYVLNPGDAYFYGVGAVHSPKRTGPTKLIRIEGRNLDHIARSPIAVAA